MLAPLCASHSHNLLMAPSRTTEVRWPRDTGVDHWVQIVHKRNCSWQWHAQPERGSLLLLGIVPKRWVCCRRANDRAIMPRVDENDALDTINA